MKTNKRPFHGPKDGLSPVSVFAYYDLLQANWYIMFLLLLNISFYFIKM